MVRSLFSSFQPFMNWISNSIPAFPARADQVSILYRPEEFYDTLVNSCSLATKRIILASLYLGTGDKEKHLVNVITSRINQEGTSLKVHILLDAVRGSRGVENNSRKMLIPLIESNPHCQVSLFHSPKLSGFLRWALPMRYNELIGLQHMKVYIIDDDVLISGANLSHDYFANRQDRYVLVKDCKDLADFYDGLISIIGKMSFQLTSSDETTLLTKYHPYKEPKMYMKDLSEKISKYYSASIKSRENFDESDTWIFPTIEIPPCDIHVDSESTNRLLQFLPPASVVYLASGYFNLTNTLVNTILKSEAEYDILMAHPTANGFYKSGGFSQFIPAIYTAIGKKFFELLEKHGVTERIRMFEFQKRNWTYHSKGIWVALPGEMLPKLTVIGSSNYGERSEKRDLEAQMIIVTDNFELKKSLYREQRQLFDFGSAFTRLTFSSDDRKVPFWIRGLSFLLKSFF